MIGAVSMTGFAAAALVPFAAFAQQRPPQEESDLIGTLVRIAFVLFFFIIPVIGAVLKKFGNALGKQTDRPTPRVPGGELEREVPRDSPRTELERSGKDLWREIMEGRAPEPPASRPPPLFELGSSPDVVVMPPLRPALEQARSAPQPVRSAATAPPSVHEPVEGTAPMYGGLAPADSARERSLAGFELVDEDAIEAGDRVAHVPLAQFAGLASSPFADMFERDPMRFAATAFTESALATRSLTRLELRRAVLLAEVIGPPVILRPGHDPLGAPGLRPL